MTTDHDAPAPSGRRPTNAAKRAWVCFLLGLPLVVVLMLVFKPLLGPVRADPWLGKVVFGVVLAWVVTISGYGMFSTFGTLAREIRASPNFKPGLGTSLAMAANGISGLLALLMMVMTLFVD